ncbi:chloride channel protein [Amycolatopsis pigmentata]|uniref:Chloride channel protein n=1 Tax=Amycolatopsis pigmentata TaxID=450801 RepID=A0ABW5FM14_9PSEU
MQNVSGGGDVPVVNPSTVAAGAARPAHLGDFHLRPRVLLITALAVPVGCAAAVAAFALLRLIGLITNAVFYQRLGTGLVAPGAAHHPWWLVLCAPVAGGLVIGVMARFGSEKIRGHGMPEAIEAILTGGSRVAPRVAVLKPVSAAVSIGTGGPFGAEGPIIMTGGAVGSILAQSLKLSADERKTLLVAGSAGGMAATFNAPLASILLAVELLLFEWRPRSLIPVATAVAVSTVCRSFLLGTGPIFGVPPSSGAPGPLADGLALVPGLTGGLLAIAATALVYLAEDAFALLPVHWMWWPALGGLIIGVGGLAEPRALGVGYDVIGQLLTGHATAALIIGILVVKTLIWSLSLGSGTSGGVLAPVFMIGAALGAAEGGLLPHVAPGFWAMCGLAAVVGGVMRSPLTGIVFTCELTGAWNDLLPLAVASVSAYALSVLLLKRSVLTEKIARRKLHLTREYTTDPLETFFAHEVMSHDVTVLRTAETIATVLPRTGYATLYPVTDDTGRLVGVTSRRALLTRAGRTVQDTITPVRVLAHPDDTLREVANKLAAGHVTGAPVVARGEPGRVLGVITLPQLLHARRRDLYEEGHRERLLTTRANGRGA